MGLLKIAWPGKFQPENEYHILARDWNKLSALERKMFNAMMDALTEPGMQTSLRHPDMPILDKNHWFKLSYNIALHSAPFLTKATSSMAKQLLDILFSSKLTQVTEEEYIQESLKALQEHSKSLKKKRK